MEQLQNLIIRFKELNGSAAFNLRILSPYIEDNILKIRLSLALDAMASCLTQVHTMLSNASVYGSLAKDLFKSVNEVDQNLFGSMNQQQILDIESFLTLIGSIPVKCSKLYEEILNPSCKILNIFFSLVLFLVLTVKIGGRQKSKFSCTVCI